MSTKDTSPPAPFEQAYTQLRAIAGAHMRNVSPGSTLQATALVHEVYLKLARSAVQFADHTHFVRTAAVAMRQILVDHARARQREKRGGDWARVTMSALDGVGGPVSAGLDVLLLDDALGRLQHWDARQAQIVELRFFAGLSVAEVATVLAVSEKTVKRDWSMARAWLQRELAPAP